MEQDKREKELMNTAQTSECDRSHPDTSQDGSPRIGTSNHRPASVQSTTAADETKQQHVTDAALLVQSARVGRVVQNASQTRKSGAAVPHQHPPCGRPHGRLQSATDMPVPVRRALPAPGRHVSTRHGGQATSSQLGTIPSRRDESRQATNSTCHTGQAGPPAPPPPSRSADIPSVAGGLHHTAETRRTGAVSKAVSGMSEAELSAGVDHAIAGNLQATGKRQEYIATGEVVGVPVHTRADHYMPTSSRTSSTDLHTIPKVEHVSHVKISMRNEGVTVCGCLFS